MELCNVCSELVLELKYIKRQALGPYDEIVSKSHSLGSGRRGCGGCAFFCAVLQGSDRWSYRLSELSGHLVFFDSLHLDVKRPGDSSHSYSIDDLLFDLCTEKEETDPLPEIDFRRPVPVDPLDESCLAKVRSWMKACIAHSGCRNFDSAMLPKRVIEISSDPSVAPRLFVSDGELGQYVVLSHCWGKSTSLKLIDSRIPKFQEAIAIELLPRSFSDAIEITRRLGFRYLWIDALCISQDNVEDWAEESLKMASYYGRSALMISATVAEDSSRGILHDRHVPISPIMGRDKKYCLRQRLLRWDWDIDHSVLSTRGWTAQERMLAPRILHFTKRQLIWECAEGFKFEASGIQETIIGSGQVDLNFSKNRLQPYITRAFDPPTDSGVEETEVKDVLQRVRVWQQCVDEYSTRDLTIPSDKFPAISGVAAIINYDGKMGQYLAGVWSNHVAAGLAWGRQYALLTSPPAYRAPSWSWGSVDGGKSSLILASTLKLLEPPVDDIGKMWATKFDLKLVEHCIKLQDESNPYGIVLQGSYIILEGTCITKDELLRLTEELSEIGFDGPAIGMDKTNAYDCPCCGPSGPEDLKDLSDDDNPNSEMRQNLLIQGDAHFDLGLFLFSDVWHNPGGFVDLLLLRWTNEDKGVAERVGLSRTTIFKHEGSREGYCEKFLAADWKRMEIKLV